MAANNLGTAYIKIAPQMQGIQKSISDGLAGIKSTSLPGAAALGTVIAKGVSSAMNLVTSSLDGAIKRTDVLNNFPKVMQNLGISTEDAQKSINRLVEGLDGLPTALQDGATAVQRFTSRNNDIEKSTEIFLALNNAILAGGASAEIQTSALEQMSQAYAKGKPDMMEWRTLMMAMPAQLNQIAKSMGLGENAADKLGESLRKGEISMDAFMDEIIKLNKKGVGNLANFEEQARGATAGIGTALTNLGNRAQKAISSIIQSFGSKDISDAINKFSSSFAGIADWISSNIVPIIKNTVIPMIKNVLSAIKSVVEFIAQNKWVQNFLVGILNTIIAYKAVKEVVSIVSGVASSIAAVGKAAASHIGNVAKFIGLFAQAKGAGMTFGESLQWVNTNTTGLSKTLTEAHGAVGGFTSKLLGIATAAGAVTLAIEGINALILINDIQTTEATTAIRDYENAHWNLNSAVRAAGLGHEQYTDAVNAARVAEEAATNAEIAAIQARQDQARYQEELNKLIAEGKQGTDEYRLAELRLDQAKALEKKANEELAASEEELKSRKEEIDNLNRGRLFLFDKTVAMTMREAQEYGSLAAQLDQLREKTIRYKDENGNMVEASKEQSEEFVTNLALALQQGDETWYEITQTAIEEGISFSEACARYGAEAGEGMMGNFKNNVDFNIPLASEATQEAVNAVHSAAENFKEVGSTSGRTFIDRVSAALLAGKATLEANGYDVSKAAVDKANEAAKNSYGVGRNLTQGAADGINDRNATTTLWGRASAVIAAAVQKMRDAGKIQSPSKVTAEIGKFLSLGLAKGIEDYADEAISAAENMATDTMAAMNENVSLEGNMSRLQPQTDPTSGIRGSGGQVIQNNEFYVDSELDVKEVSKRLGWQVATAL